MLLSESRISLGQDFARALDPVLLARDCGIEPDAVQARLLTSPARRLLVNVGNGEKAPVCTENVIRAQ